MKKPIHHTFGPLATPAQIRNAFLLQWAPWRWLQGTEHEMFREALERKFGMEASLFATGREGLLGLLRSMEIGGGDEVIIQGYTCAVVPNAILAAGGTPIYADIQVKTLSLDPVAVRRAITPRTRAMICQHTFGIPADISALRIICDEKNLALIEDCAHVLPDTIVRGGIGTAGDAVLLSFGRDKAISGVTGGAVLCRHQLIGKRMRALEETAAPLSRWTVMQLIGYPLRYALAKNIWPLGIGKGYLRALRACRMLPAILQQQEKMGRMDAVLHAMPNACAILALQQLESLHALNERRRMITQYFTDMTHRYQWPVVRGVDTAPALQKYPLLLEGAQHIRAALKKQHIYLDDGWNNHVVNPRSVNEQAIDYTPGRCPHAETIARQILSLPVHPTMTVAEAARTAGALHTLIQTT